jgi:phosphoenolpyruvate-protein phosphotransferase
MEMRRKGSELEGLAISPGLALGKAYIYHDILQRKYEQYRIKPREVESEWRRIKDAIEDVKAELREAAGRIEEQLQNDAAEILFVQEAMLEDPELLKDLEDTLWKEQVNGEHVVKEVMLRWETKIQQSEMASAESETRQKHEDVADLTRRLLRRLEGISAHALEDMPAGSVLIARRLLPSDTVFLSRKSASAVVVEYGGRVSHAAILTRELGIPGVAQVEGILGKANPADTVYVDGDNGRIVLNPEPASKVQLLRNIEQRWDGMRTARAHRHEPAFASSNTVVKVTANVGCREDVVHANANGADGIGLYRTEHLFFSRSSPPSEEEIAENLSGALEPVKGKAVTLRLLDAGGDKDLPFLNIGNERNPFLGQQGIRILRRQPELFKAQLRAMVRLSSEHDIRILVPMVTFADEMKEAREALLAAAREMGAKRTPRIGAMIETPAAALCAGKIARHSDFLSIGSNDLTQYIMVADRENPAVAEYFVENHPAIMRLLRHVVREAGDLPVSICGEMAGRREMLPDILSLGITRLSVAPVLIPEVKEAVRTVRIPSSKPHPPLTG